MNGQCVVNKSIPLINDEIKYINEQSQVKTPLIAQHIHKSRRGRCSHRYLHGTRGGIHFSSETITKYIKNFIRTFSVNIHATCN